MLRLLSGAETNTQKSTTKSKYYFGHFLFEEKNEKKFEIIDETVAKVGINSKIPQITVRQAQ